MSAARIIIGCRRQGVRFWSFADALASGMPVAQWLGRFGNYFNHELFGLPTTLPWGLQILLTDILVLGRRFEPRWGCMVASLFIW